MAIISQASVHVESNDPKQKDSQIRIRCNSGALARFGLIMRVVVSVPGNTANAGVKAPSKAVMVNALLDTGATRTSIDLKIAKMLGLPPIGFVQIGTAGGKQKSTIHVADVSFPNTGLSPRKTIPIGSCDLSFDPNVGLSSAQNIGALIGRDILSHWVVVWNGPYANVTICD